MIPTAPLYEGDGTWWVRTWNDAGFGPWSAAGRLTLTTATAPPAPVTVIGTPTGTTDATPTFTWDAVAGATRYYLWVDDADGAKTRQWFTAGEAVCAEGAGGSCRIEAPTALSGAGTSMVGVTIAALTLGATLSGPATAMDFVQAQRLEQANSAGFGFSVSVCQ